MGKAGSPRRTLSGMKAVYPIYNHVKDSDMKTFNEYKHAPHYCHHKICALKILGDDDQQSE